jgi:hypothetical protein
MRLVVYGRFTLQVLAGALVFALVAYAVLLVLGWT